jgi:Copper amine oxidase N-terminal domain/Intracellular proteinase inhibitor
MYHTTQRCRPAFRLLGMMGIVSCAGAFSPAFGLAVQPIRVQVNGIPVQFNGASPLNINGRVLVPLRSVLERMGATVSYDAAARTIRVQRGGTGETKVRLRVGSSRAYVNGQMQTLDAPARVHRGNTLVPLRFVAEAFGAQIGWNEGQSTVSIASQQIPSPLSGTYANSAEVDVINDEANEGTPKPTAASPITVTLTADKDTYRAGETVAFTVTARNDSAIGQELNFSSGQSFDITVLPAGKEDSPRWDWSYDRRFTMELRTLALAPGETKTWSTTWDQKDNEGAVMPRGAYEAKAKLTANGHIPAAPITLTLTD